MDVMIWSAAIPSILAFIPHHMSFQCPFHLLKKKKYRLRGRSSETAKAHRG
eukprot:TRINITY_DN6791_c0_g1_i1.p2 TRINITY_DN6791_c0_g1~~TRINITY_DN6791_c0_g1_i1.p2  ORF type:complete len:51 (+),score=15.71 TRINITY_DN6791_c0_g1_i1:153-305(+)